MTIEQWDIPQDYVDLVARGNASYSITGVLTQNNMDAMQLFLDALSITNDKVVLDDGTQVFLAHPDSMKLIRIDSSGLGDFDLNEYDVSVIDRSSLKMGAAP